jgi:hypothetical protein
LAAATIETFLVPRAASGPRILPAPRVGQLPTVMLPTAERATQVRTPRVPRMSEEADATLATRHGTLCQIRPLAQDGIQGRLILANQRDSAVVLVPIFAKRIEFGDRDDKNARFSVMI